MARREMHKKVDLLHLLFPHVRAEILRILFSKSNRETYGRQAARETTLALRTVQRELYLLETAGLLTSHRRDGCRFFQPNSGHPLFAGLCQVVRKGSSGKRFVNRAKKPRQSWRNSGRRHRQTKFVRSALPKSRSVWVF